MGRKEPYREGDLEHTGLGMVLQSRGPTVLMGRQETPNQGGCGDRGGGQGQVLGPCVLVCYASGGFTGGNSHLHFPEGTRRHHELSAERPSLLRREGAQCVLSDSVRSSNTGNA